MIRLAEQSDVDGIFSIESDSFSLPFTKQLFSKMIAAGPFFGLTAEDCGKVSGYVFCSVAADEAEILTIAVEKKRRKKGLGRKLLQAAIGAAKAGGAKTIFLEARQSSTAAISLYSGLGFVKNGVRKKYYADNGEDAVTMKLAL